MGIISGLVLTTFAYYLGCAFFALAVGFIMVLGEISDMVEKVK